MIKWNWKQLDAGELDDTSYHVTIPERAGLYVWRLKCCADVEPDLPSSDFVDALARSLRRPIGYLPASQLDFTTQLGPLQIGGGALTPEKIEFLKGGFSTRPDRDNLVEFCRQLASFAPPIYVGQTDNLRKRVLEHRQGKSSLENYIRSNLKREWTDVTLNYLALPDELSTQDQKAKKVLETLEMITQLHLAPHGVKRPG
jgi:hypothetical protein